MADCIERLKGIVVDDALKSGTHIGPVVDQGQRDQDLKHIQIAKDEGGKLAFGGEFLKRETPGFYLPIVSPYGRRKVAQTALMRRDCVREHVDLGLLIDRRHVARVPGTMLRNVLSRMATITDALTNGISLRPTSHRFRACDHRAQTALPYSPLRGTWQADRASADGPFDGQFRA